MRTFDYRTVPPELLTPEVMNLVSAIHEYRGRERHYGTARPEQLRALRDVARIQSTGASNRIEGIYTSGDRLRMVVEGRSEPHDREEAQIAGYRDVLDTIHQSHEYIDVTPGVILQLHRDLFRSTGLSIGGRWKDSDNAIVEVVPGGARKTRFLPPPAREVPEAMQRLCDAHAQSRAGDADPLLTACMFAFDFVCIQQFNDGNGRMSRLLTLLLLYKAGYGVGAYVSLEGRIEQTKDGYYDALARSSVGWGDGTNDYAPIVTYLLGCIVACYRTLDERLALAGTRGATKADRVWVVFQKRLGKITKDDIRNECPDVSVRTIERALADLSRRGLIRKVDAGPATGYVRVSKS